MLDFFARSCYDIVTRRITNDHQTQNPEEPIRDHATSDRRSSRRLSESGKELGWQSVQSSCWKVNQGVTDMNFQDPKERTIDEYNSERKEVLKDHLKRIRKEDPTYRQRAERERRDFHLTKLDE
jgi:molecular chaperone GrpE (heat shock protein)